MAVPVSAPYRLPSRDGFPSLRSCDNRMASSVSRASSAASVVTSGSSSYSERSQSSNESLTLNSGQRLRRRKSKRKKLSTGLQPIEELLENGTYNNDPISDILTDSESNAKESQQFLPQIQNSRIVSQPIDNSVQNYSHYVKSDFLKPDSGCEKREHKKTQDPDTGTGNSPPWMRRSNTELFIQNTHLKPNAVRRIKIGNANFKLDPVFKSQVLQLHENSEIPHETRGNPCDDVTSQNGDRLQSAGSIATQSNEDGTKVWRTLPMSSELQSYINRLHKKNGRDSSFSTSLNMPSLKNPSDSNSAYVANKLSLIEKQRSRYGKTTLRQNMNNTATENILAQKNRTYELHSKVKSILQDGLLRRS